MATDAAPRRSFAFFVASGIFLSRVAGLIRERVFAHYFGTSAAAGAFKAALRIPNFLQNMFGEGVLSASFIPVYARLVAAGDEKTAGRVAGVIATLLSIIVTILVAAGVLFTPFIVTLIAPGFEASVRDLTIRLVRILFPGIGLLVLSAWCLGILNSHRRFFISYVAPVLWNFAMIATMLIFAARSSVDELAEWLAWGTVAGCVLQFAIQIPFVLQVEKNLRFGVDILLQPVREVVRNFGPVFIGRGVIQVSAYVDEAIGTLLGGSVFAAITYAQVLYLLPVSLFGMSVAAAELAEMSREQAVKDEGAARLRKRLELGLRQIAFLVIPTTVAYLVIGRFLVSGIFQTGAFDLRNAYFVWYILGAYALGLIASTMGRLYSSAFYALGDTRTPLRIALTRVIGGGIFAYLFAFPLRQPFVVLIRDVLALPMPQLREEGIAVPAAVALGAVGLAFGSAIAAWIEFLLLRRSLTRRVGAVHVEARFFFFITLASIAAAGAAYGGALISAPMAEWALAFGLARIAHAAVICSVFGVTYFAMTALLKVPESRSVLRRLTRR